MIAKKLHRYDIESNKNDIESQIKENKVAKDAKENSRDTNENEKKIIGKRTSYNPLEYLFGSLYSDDLKQRSRESKDKFMDNTKIFIQRELNK